MGMTFSTNSLDFSYKNHTLLGIPWIIQVAVSRTEANKNKSPKIGANDRRIRMTDTCTDIPGTRGKPMRGHFWNMTHPQGQDPEIPILGIKPQEAEQAKFSKAPAEPEALPPR